MHSIHALATASGQPGGPRVLVRTGADRPAHVVRGPEGTQVIVPAPTGASGHPAEDAYTWGRVVGALLVEHAWAWNDAAVEIDLSDTDPTPLRNVAGGLIDGLGGVQSLLLPKVFVSGHSDPDAAQSLSRARADMRAVALARELVDLRASELTPERLADRAEQIGDSRGMDVLRWASKDLEDEGMGSILAVGQGSIHPPALVRLDHLPDSTSPRVCLVGKGVTFDTGGLSLKSPDAMVGMHTDMAGAAVVLAVMSVLCDLGVQTPVSAFLPMAENVPGPGATRPGDLVTTWDGRDIEVVDTDFEGRVLMADALALASAGVPAPDAVIDVATLTYQAVTALGPQIGAVVARDSDLGARVLAAATAAGEPLWPLPWAPRYREQIRSLAREGAVRNHPQSDTGRALTAALFLGEFVPAQIPWAHLDIAGPSVSGSGADGVATGFGVRTLIRLLEHWTS